MYDNLVKALYKTRKSLHQACFELSVNGETINPEQLTVTACDWCGVWEKPKVMFPQPDGTVYCGICNEMHLYHYD